MHVAVEGVGYLGNGVRDQLVGVTCLELPVFFHEEIHVDLEFLDLLLVSADFFHTVVADLFHQPLVVVLVLLEALLLFLELDSEIAYLLLEVVLVFLKVPDLGLEVAYLFLELLLLAPLLFPDALELRLEPVLFCPQLLPQLHHVAVEILDSVQGLLQPLFGVGEIIFHRLQVVRVDVRGSLDDLEAQGSKSHLETLGSELVEEAQELLQISRFERRVRFLRVVLETREKIRDLLAEVLVLRGGAQASESVDGSGLGCVEQVGVSEGETSVSFWSVVLCHAACREKSEGTIRFLCRTMPTTRVRLSQRIACCSPLRISMRRCRRGMHEVCPRTNQFCLFKSTCETDSGVVWFHQLVW